MRLVRGWFVSRFSKQIYLINIWEIGHFSEKQISFKNLEKNREEKEKKCLNKIWIGEKEKRNVNKLQIIFRLKITGWK